jgi:hypothetical protein
MAKKTQDELREDLCNYCELEDNNRGAVCYGGEPQFCFESGYCKKAYDTYLESEDDEDE